MIEEKKEVKASNEDEFHDRDNKISLEIFTDLDENIKCIEYLFHDCMDVVKREVNICKDAKFRIYGVYVDGLVNRDILENYLLSKVFEYKNLNGEVFDAKITPTKLVMQHFSATFDVKEVEGMDAMANAVLSGDSAIFVEGSKTGLVIATRGWPARGVSEPATESVVRGPRDGFTETIRFNTVLVRRRIRDTKLK